jgi:hypothetical protein
MVSILARIDSEASNFNLDGGNNKKVMMVLPQAFC